MRHTYITYVYIYTQIYIHVSVHIHMYTIFYKGKLETSSTTKTVTLNFKRFKRGIKIEDETY